MSYCDFDALERTPLERDPFDYIVIPDFLKSDRFPRCSRTIPRCPAPARIRRPNSPSAAISRR